ncbi:glycosyltransferase family 4 protein [Winogradskyella sp. PE311]|uniref:glycosyltransferase family 4 protein n=1 Tax=Winogradskyella sp. PE311 TaxID=3366943 RepID=UPI00397F3987
MKLAYVTNSINGTSGLERMVSIQTNYFLEYFDYEIDLILLDQNEDNSDGFYPINSNINRYYLNLKSKGCKNLYQKAKGLNQILNKIEPDIVVVCDNDIFSLYIPIFINSRYKTVYQRHNANTINLDRRRNTIKIKFLNTIKKILIKYAGKGYDRFVLLSNSHKNDWKRLNNIEVIGNPTTIDTKGQRAILKEKTVLAVGRHDPVKGFDMLLLAWAKVLDKNPDWTLNIVGKKTHGIDLKKIAKDLGILNKVIFKEYTNDVSKLYLESSILVCSSILEGLPLVIIEAMSFGLPVVSFDCNYGPRDLITDSEDGIIVPQNNIDKLSESLNYLIDNEDIRFRYGQNAQNNIQRYSMENIMSKWKHLFEELMKE